VPDGLPDRTVVLCEVSNCRWGADYGGFSNYVTAAIFPEYLKFCEERPQGVVNLFQAPVLEDASQHQEERTRSTFSTDSEAASCGKISCQIARIFENQAERKGVSFPAASPDNCELCLADFLYDR
jgi:hypothetical protein